MIIACRITFSQQLSGICSVLSTSLQHFTVCTKCRVTTNTLLYFSCTGFIHWMISSSIQAHFIFRLVVLISIHLFDHCCISIQTQNDDNGSQCFSTIFFGTVVSQFSRQHLFHNILGCLLLWKIHMFLHLLFLH